VPEQARLDMLARERFAQEGVGIEVNLADRKVIGGAPVRVDLLEFFSVQCDGN